MVALTIASALGSSEGAIKLLLTIIVGYPLAFLYRSKSIYSLPPLSKHILFLIIGLLIGYYNFGLWVLHSIANIVIVYLVLFLFGGNKFSTIFIFAFNTAYLVVGYYFQISYKYGISWTMPHCVLTLRLIGVAFDYFDGQKKNIPKDQQDSALQKCPSLLELLSHTFYFGGYMVGPQFSMKRYLAFINGEFSNPKTGEAPDSIFPGLRRLCLGIGYIFVYQSFCLFIPDLYLYSPEFANHNIIFKCALILLWGKNTLHKYIGVWLMQEGVITVMGLSHNGVDEKGHIRWDACANIHVKDLELGYTFDHFIRSFNVNTNQWMSKYVFKRLRFLGSKIVSQLLTLFYLALWHGVQSGYYMCFFLELLYTNAERKIDVALSLVFADVQLPNWTFVKYLRILFRKIIVLFLWAYALIPFSLHDLDKWFPVYKASLYVGLTIPVFAAIICHIIIMLKPRKRLSNGVSHSEDAQPKKENADNVDKKEL